MLRFTRTHRAATFRPSHPSDLGAVHVHNLPLLGVVCLGDCLHKGLGQDGGREKLAEV